MGKQLPFLATDEEVAILDEHNIRWSAFCHGNINKLKQNKSDRNDLFDKIVLRTILILMGCLIAGLTPLLNDVILVMFEYMIAIAMVLVGTISMIFLLRDTRGRRRRVLQ